MNQSPYIMDELKNLKTNEGLSKTIIKEGLNKRREAQYENTKKIKPKTKEAEEQEFLDSLFS